MGKGYTTKGSVRGECGHAHRTIRGALACLERDRRDCAGLPGGSSYSDRAVRRADGAPLAPGERAELAWGGAR